MKEEIQKAIDLAVKSISSSEDAYDIIDAYLIDLRNNFKDYAFTIIPDPNGFPNIVIL